MTEIVKYVPEGVRKRIQFKNDDELIFETKKVYIEHIGGFRGGKKLLEYLEQIYGIDSPSNSIEELCKKMDLVDIYYYFAYLFAATQNSNIFTFKRNEERLFSWDEVPGNDSRKLIEFLKLNLDNSWVKTTKIEKIDILKTIRVSTEKNYLLLRLNDEKTRVNLKIDDVGAYKFIAKTENGILNIYGETNGNQCSELFNNYGQPIWDNQLSVNQKLWVCYRENVNHVFLAFVSIGTEKHYFDPILQSFNKHTETGLINCRIHFDDHLIEVTPKNIGEDSITEALGYIKNRFNIISINSISITDKDIREFDKEVKQVTHEKREGEETTTALTRANKEGDTRKDTLHEEINSREFRKEHGLLEINDNTHSIIGLTRGDVGRVQFKSYLEPSKRLLLFHNLKDILRWEHE